MKSVSIFNVFIIILINFSNYGSAVELLNDGGYKISIAIEESTPEPTNIESYLNNIQNIIADFSNKFFLATKKKFYIESLSILVPSHWAYNKAQLSTSESYTLADIRISPEFKFPRVDNPNSCVSSGNYIELPISFFESQDFGYYGLPSKALVVQWARLRYGVWEEHGYPGDFRFPYFYKKPEIVNEKWMPNGCYQDSLEGEYINIEDNEKCVFEDENGPHFNCRFIPRENQKSKSSLMHFHWLNSTIEFCDKHSHRTSDPNRQNVFCGHLSIWEVIEKTIDYSKLKESKSNFPKLTTRIVQKSKVPIFYLLMDSGYAKVLPRVIPEVVKNLKTIFNGTFTTLNTIGGLSIYPENHDVEKVINWLPIFGNEGKFNAFLENFSTNGPIVRDFGQILLNVIEEIQLLDHKAGAVVLIVKTGVGSNTFNSLAYESQLISAVKEARNLKIFGVEVVVKPQSPNINLKRLVSESRGEHVLVEGEFGISASFRPFLSSLSQTLSKPIEENLFKTFYKGFVECGKTNKMPILGYRILNFEIYFTTKSVTSEDEIHLKTNGHVESVVFERRDEWDEHVDLNRRSSFYTKLPGFPISPVDNEWEFDYTCDSSLHSGHLVIIAEFEQIFSNSIKEVEREEIKVQVSTSASSENVIDMGSVWPKSSPFAIYARVELNGRSLYGLSDKQVIAQVVADGKSWEVELKDDGIGVPDVLPFDGLYSAHFVPPHDGAYKISVRVHGDPSTHLHPPGDQNKKYGKFHPTLLPVDQKVIGCERCEGISRFNLPFTVVQDLPKTVRVVNSPSYFLGTPERILDLTITERDKFIIFFNFTAPGLIGEKGKVQQYNVYTSQTLEAMREDPTAGRVVASFIALSPGENEGFSLAASQEVVPYFTIEAVNYINKKGNLRAGPSNIARAHTRP